MSLRTVMTTGQDAPGTRRSASGWCVDAWVSFWCINGQSTQSVVASSTAEAELNAVVRSMAEIWGLMNMMKGLPLGWSPEKAPHGAQKRSNTSHRNFRRSTSGFLDWCPGQGAPDPRTLGNCRTCVVHSSCISSSASASVLASSEDHPIPTE